MSEKQPLLSTVTEVIDALGGPTGLIEWAKTQFPHASISKSAVSNWKAEGWIPPAWFLAFSTELARRGHTVDPKVFRQLSVVNDA